ncbi:MAG: membrane protein insertase YidC [Bacteroidetes bacterium]|nr:membrane protein insertase YidC [Bacteroidota bacterium]
MDKRSILGLLIIGAILLIFSIFNSNQQPEKNTTSAQDSTVQTTDAQTDKPVTNGTLVPKRDSLGNQLIDSLDRWVYTDTLTGRDTFIVLTQTTETIQIDSAKLKLGSTPNNPEELVRLENDLLIIELTNKGGKIKNVFLKKFKTYDAFVTEKAEPLQLIDSASTYAIEFFEGDIKRHSDDYTFRFTDVSATGATAEMLNSTGRKVQFKYSLTEGKYDVDFQVSFKGFSEADAKSISFRSDFKLRATEKYLPNEKQVAALFFKYNEESYDYLQGNQWMPLEQTTQWVAFKQSYFAAILMSQTGFPRTEKSKISIKDLPETDSTYVKQYKSTLDLGITSINNTVDLKWYFGPNDYDILATYENGSEDIVDLGWGLFRWINVYAMRPMFKFFIGWGMGIGMAILLLTIVWKLILSPVNYKMYKSSAMMKVLKPEIDELGKKFPKKEDAVKKQQAMMALYRETGVSPFAGCIPMLIQMPILFAIFRLFPSSLELRQKPFLWAEDLSSYDSILNFSFNIPFYGDHISLFTLLMSGTTLLYTWYNSANMQQPTQEGMPNLKYIMYIFPFLMIFFFNNFSAGLSYYYFISTLITIVIMWAIKRFIIDEVKIHAQIQANKANPVKKEKSKFAQRLEEAQRLQAERSKKK